MWVCSVSIVCVCVCVCTHVSSAGLWQWVWWSESVTEAAAHKTSKLWPLCRPSAAPVRLGGAQQLNAHTHTHTHTHTHIYLQAFLCFIFTLPLMLPLNWTHEVVKSYTGKGCCSSGNRVRTTLLGNSNMDAKISLVLLLVIYVEMLHYYLFITLLD